MKRFITKFIAIGACLLMTLASVNAQGQTASNTTIKVVATFSILADMAKNIGQDRVTVTSLVPANGDAHNFNPSPSDMKVLAQADLIILNGLDFENWAERLIKASRTKARIIIASEGITTIQNERDHSHKHDHGEADPHAWHSVSNAKVYVRNIRDGLIAADLNGRVAYEIKASAYLEELNKLEKEITHKIQQIPADRRKILVMHDAFKYYERDYKLTFIAPKGLSTKGDASARDIARIINQMKRENIRAGFIENIADPRLIQRIIDETGAKIGGKLYSDALSEENGSAKNYIEMMRHNTNEFLTALQ